ncbi:MAG: iron-containing alcohol dehydrogenase [Oscillospiraceae bacterium]|nr:iron-containing alcohol dehydrogenase [Oscillospiraceae bacterium]
MELFSCATRIISGPGSVGALGELEIRRLFLVTDPYFEKKGIAAQVAAQAKAEQTEIFSGVEPDPSLALAAEATAKAKAFCPDTVVALGGGSAMDLAKAVAYFSGLKPRLVCIPTTSGSGSEVTDFAILTHEGIKQVLVDASIRPCAAILDSDLLEQLPPSLIADSGFDILAHALEAWAAKGAGAVSDALALAAFETAYSHLSASFAGDKNKRLAIHEAACMAGMAFSQAGLGLCHAIAHALGGITHLPHGRLNAILLPWVIDINAQACGKRYGELAARAGLGVSRQLGARNLKNALVCLRRELKLPGSLGEAGADLRLVERHRQDIISAALADPCCASNPLKVDASAVGRVLECIKG